MSNLKYKTRGNSDPKGKPRVYFCCHPRDFELYFERISDEILTEQNCAIWYNSNPNEDYDELFFTDLKQMQLFVIPITSEFLCSYNGAMEKEFPFAVENHIPILPLMQEGGLEKLFNKKCGDLQFLDKNQRDPTAISYEEKLKKFLNTTLVDDELAEKIRSAFDAYLFLSYRKKDRKYAQELMKLIHKNDFCRDVAIWYDEFLTPGENFNDSIKQALQKSELFVLAVTPNLINETNYIMTTEYPMARQEGKAILPAELELTDKTQLVEKYTEIPDCINAYNEQELAGALTKEISETVIGNNNSPEHRFFIGLAYQNGIDVEVDHTRALSLITSAADDELIEAIEKLVEMYCKGIGVCRSYETAVQWQEKLITLHEIKYRENPSVVTLDKLFWSICKCGDIFADMNSLVKQTEKYRDAQRILTEDNAFNTELNIRLDLSAIYMKLCSAHLMLHVGVMEREGVNEALDFCRESINISKEVLDDVKLPEVHRSLAEGYITLGEVYLNAFWADNPQKSDLDNARYSYEMALQIYDSIAEELDTTEHMRSILPCYTGLGRVYHSDRIFERARQNYEKAIQISECLEKESKTIGDLWKLADSYRLIGNMFYDNRQFYNAKQYLEKYLLIIEKIFKETNSMKAREELSTCYYSLFILYNETGDADKAAMIRNKASQLHEDSAEKNAPQKDNQSVSEDNLLVMCYESAREGDAPLPEEEKTTYCPCLHRISTKEIIAIDKPVFKIGRDRGRADYCINNNRTISKVHAEINVLENKCYIIDLFSTNYTYINGKSISPQCKTELLDGDHIRLGNEEFVFSI